MCYLFGEHVITHDGEFFCRLCQRQFPSFDAIYSHCQAASHHPWCQACKLVFLDKTELQEHRDDPRYHHFCPDCDSKIDFSDEEQLDAHRAEAHFWCGGCDLICASKRSLNTHLIYEHAACEICFEVFEDMERCRAHMRTHISDEYRCPGCGYKNEIFSVIIQHLESSSECGGFQQVMRLVKETPGFRDFYISSSSEFDFYCKSCLRRWSTLGELALHLEAATECEWLLYPDETFSSLRQLLGRRRRQELPQQL
ncbi:hypothetical protein PMG11_03129 [Penicillium brasilianum]|uniref:C2H2-type domain-containing protein n=1 Tax=Penicillium brasilianum TaxID=104259 RepID=A0A0F7VER2_PENBI|nr:hypothetical protein PMG11_03129 [Penicillium brasilianum]